MRIMVKLLQVGADVCGVWQLLVVSGYGLW
jgi:hypothetical protein